MLSDNFGLGQIGSTCNSSLINTEALSLPNNTLQLQSDLDLHRPQKLLHQ